MLCGTFARVARRSAGAGRDALPRVRRYTFRRFFLLPLRTRSCAIGAEALSLSCFSIFLWTCGAARETYRRVGVSAFAKHHQLRRDLVIIIAVSKSSLTAPDADTPIRRPADTLLQPADHFERNDVTIICETVHQDFFAEMLSIRPRSGSKDGTIVRTSNISFLLKFVAEHL